MGTAPLTKILIVDDSTAFLALFSSILPKAGYEVSILNDPALVFLRAVQLRPDIMLIDVNMPGFDGPTVVRKLKRVTHLASTPILLCSGEEQARLEETARDCGASGAVSKMLGAYEIVQRIRAYNPLA